jgi:hypothetical protein
MSAWGQERRRLPIMRTLVAAYRDLGRLLTTMRALMLSAFLIMLATSVAGDLVPQRLWDQELAGEALGLAQNAIEAFLLTPIAIAIHRFVILDKITPNYTVPIGDPVFGIFFGWLLALKALTGLPIDLLGVLQTLNWAAGKHACFCGGVDRGYRCVAAADDPAPRTCRPGARRDACACAG